MNYFSERSERKSLFLVSLAILAGLVAASHMGKIPGSLPYLREFFHLSLAQSGIIVSSFSVISALFGLMIGLFSTRIGMFNAGVIGLFITALGCAIGTFSQSFNLLIFSRLIEGLGFVLIAVTMPGLINFICPTKYRAIAMGAWGGFIPAAMSLILITSPTIIQSMHWQGLWGVLAIISLVYTFIFALNFSSVKLPKGTNNTSRFAIKEVLSSKPLAIVAVFITYSALFAAVSAFLPTFWHSRFNQSIDSASFMAAIVITGNILGNLWAGHLVNKGYTLRKLVIAALVSSGIFAGLLFSEIFPLYLQFFIALGFTFCSGVLPGAVLANAAKIVAHPSGIPILIGIIFQGASVGQVLGPIGMSAAVSYSGSWLYGSIFILLLSLLGIAAGFKIRH